MAENIHLRTGVAVFREGKILLVPHYNTDFAPLQWYLPGGKVEFGEAIEAAACREFSEETGFEARLETLLDVSEIIVRETPWHSLTVCYLGIITGGVLAGEPNHRFGDKTPRWFALDDLKQLNYHPAGAIEKAFQLHLTNFPSL